MRAPRAGPALLLRGCATGGGCGGTTAPSALPELVLSPASLRRTDTFPWLRSLAEDVCRGAGPSPATLTSQASPEGTGFPAPVSNYRNLGLLEKRDLESSDPPVVPITGSSLAPPARSLPKDNWRELPSEFHTWRLASSWCRLELGPNA